jgi:hypothetical protein
MANLFRGSRAVSSAVLITVIAVAIVVCVTAGFIAYQFKPTEPSSITPTPIPYSNSPTVNPSPILTQNPTGTIQFRTVDSKGIPIKDTLVASTQQPEVHSITGLTDSSGYVTFRDMEIGTYNFHFSAAGYLTLDQTVDFKGTPLTLVITLQSEVYGIVSQEKISIQAVSYDITNKVLTIYAQSSSATDTSALNSLLVKDATGHIVSNLGIATINPSTSGVRLSPGTLYTITSTAILNGLGTGTYTVTLVTQAGSSFVSPAFTES